MTDYILEMHKHAHKHINSGVSYQEMTEHLEQMSFTIEDQREAITRAFGDIFFSPSDGNERVQAFTGARATVKHRMAPEAYFRYLSYLEYKEARSNAQQAHKASIIAIRYAKWALVATAAIGFAQIMVEIVFR